MHRGHLTLGDGNSVYMWAPKDIDISNSTIEFAVRSEIFTLSNCKNVTISGLVFQHDNTGVDVQAFLVIFSSDILIVYRDIQWNIWSGLQVLDSTNIIARRNTANYNAGCGMGAWKIKGLVFEDNEASYNNWRGVRENFTGWAVAGIL